MFTSSFLFEFQKYTIAKSLAKKISDKNIVDIFIFNNNLHSDPFENLLIIDNSKITFCSYYLPIQSKFTALIKKKLEMRIIRLTEIKSYRIVGNNIEIIKKNTEIIRFHNIPDISKIKLILDSVKQPDANTA